MDLEFFADIAKLEIDRVYGDAWFSRGRLVILALSEQGDARTSSGYNGSVGSFHRIIM
jgi:hypothetical protein